MTSFHRWWRHTHTDIRTISILRNRPQAGARTWFKNHNTYKSLIGISPSGGICFVSDLFGGNISDKQFIIQCGILEYLDEGDSIMADRGFNIGELLHAKGVALNIPPSLSDSFWPAFRK